MQPVTLQSPSTQQRPCTQQRPAKHLVEETAETRQKVAKSPPRDDEMRRRVDTWAADSIRAQPQVQSDAGHLTGLMTQVMSSQMTEHLAGLSANALIRYNMRRS